MALQRGKQTQNPSRNSMMRKEMHETTSSPFHAHMSPSTLEYLHLEMVPALAPANTSWTQTFYSLSSVGACVGTRMDRPCLHLLVYSTAVGCSGAGYGYVSSGQPEGVTTAESDSLCGDMDSVQGCSSDYKCRQLSASLLSWSGSRLWPAPCWIVDFCLMSPILNCKFPALGESRLPTRFC